MRNSPPDDGPQRGSVWRVLRGCVVLAAIHSALASRPAKHLALRLLGARYRNGLYRAFYNAQAVAWLALGTRWFVGLPDREIYRAPAPLSWLLRIAQAASLGVVLSGVRVIGVSDFAGLRGLWGLLSGADPAPEPAAQGPPLDAVGREVVNAGAFRFTRHPGNLGAVGVFLFFPRMTVNRATLAALVVVYAVLGSWHEEYRLRAAYGEAYERYRRAVPFLVPQPRRE